MVDAQLSVEDVVQRLKQILVQDLLLNVTLDEIRDDYSLLDEGLALDSIVLEEFIVQIEDQFGVRFDDRLLNTELFSNLSTLAAFVAHECAAARASGGELQSEAPV
jgi:acyl carrier protein